MEMPPEMVTVVTKLAAGHRALPASGLIGAAPAPEPRPASRRHRQLILARGSADRARPGRRRRLPRARRAWVAKVRACVELAAARPARSAGRLRLGETSPARPRRLRPRGREAQRPRGVVVYTCRLVEPVAHMALCVQFIAPCDCSRLDGRGQVVGQSEPEWLPSGRRDRLSADVRPPTGITRATAASRILMMASSARTQGSTRAPRSGLEASTRGDGPSDKPAAAL